MSHCRDGETRRLHRLLDMVREAYGWGKSDLARALRRDPSSVYPPTSNAKLDFVERLARLLEWPIDSVVETIRYGAPGTRPEPEEPLDGADFETLLNRAREAYKHGQYELTVKLARQMLKIAKTPTERAYAWDKEGAGWDGLGYYGKSIEAMRCAVQEAPVPPEVHYVMLTNLASACYLAGDLAPARGISKEVLAWCATRKGDTNLEVRMAQAFSHYVAGAAALRAVPVVPDEAHDHAERAATHLRAARRMLLALSRESDRSYFAGVANTCRAGLIVAEIELDKRDARAGIEELREGLPVTLDAEECPPGDWLESYGWWCVFGTEAALRHLRLGEMQRAVAVFTSKLSDIAERMNNWAFREFSLRMKYVARKKFEEQTGAELPEFIDAEELRYVFGAIGRFPRFRPLGWEIIQTAKVVDHA